ncbi:MAG TPA: hypothetical protein VFI10_00675 [Gaiellaceae bacterium]|nr:hypothetical protein [Gaiellaceae bacterium]
MTRLALVAAAALALAACGSSAPEQSAPKPPRLPHALAQAWARDADGVAAALAAGDGCTARDRARALQQDVIDAVNTGRVPRRLLEPLTSGVNQVAAGITCTPPPPPASSPDLGKGKAKGKKKDKGHGHGHAGKKGH